MEAPAQAEAGMPGHAGQTPDTGLVSVAGVPEKSDKISGVKKGGAEKKRRFTASGPDMVSGILVSFDAGRLYLSDNRGGIFSLAREDIKTVKRAVSFG